MAGDNGAFYFTAGAGTQKAKNLAHDPHCVVTLAAAKLDISVEGTAAITRNEATLKRLAELYAGAGWAPEVRDGAFFHEYSAPSAGPPPWDLYEVTIETVFGFATGLPAGATRWRVSKTA
jgi:hypothetical protein